LARHDCDDIVVGKTMREIGNAKSSGNSRSREVSKQVHSRRTLRRIICVTLLLKCAAKKKLKYIAICVSIQVYRLYFIEIARKESKFTSPISESPGSSILRNAVISFVNSWLLRYGVLFAQRAPRFVRRELSITSSYEIARPVS
jgi:hypothetical protein